MCIGRTMYMTAETNIMKAEMDGSMDSIIIGNLNGPTGLTVDFRLSRLFWVCFGSGTVESASYDGQNRTILQTLEGGAGPHGIITFNDNVYWGNFGSNSLQSCAKNGSTSTLHTLYVGSHSINHLILIPPVQPWQHRVNHCESASCGAGICVLTSTAFRCVYKDQTSDTI